MWRNLSYRALCNGLFYDAVWIDRARIPIWGKVWGGRDALEPVIWEHWSGNRWGKGSKGTNFRTGMTLKMVACIRVGSESSAGHELSGVQPMANWFSSRYQDIYLGPYSTSNIVVVARNSPSTVSNLGCYSKESLGRKSSRTAHLVALGNSNSVVLFTIINRQFQGLAVFWLFSNRTYIYLLLSLSANLEISLLVVPKTLQWGSSSHIQAQQ